MDRTTEQAAMDKWWTSNLINPQALTSLYDNEPRLDGFILLSLGLEERGPNCLIRGQMPTFPDRRRPTWKVDANRLRLRFSLGAVERFSARGDELGGPVDLRIERADDGFGIIVAGKGESFEFEAQGIGLQLIGMTADRMMII